MSGALIVTAELPRDLHRWATALREAHFPPERNYLDAHVTLFHALPPSCEGEVRTALADMARRAPVPARLEGPMSLGRGTALKLDSPAMIALWRELADRFDGVLSAQDQHKPRLHVTIQNKVSGKEAKALQAQLAGTVEPRDFAFRALALHIYRDGPWEHVRDYPFRGPNPG